MTAVDLIFLYYYFNVFFLAETKIAMICEIISDHILTKAYDIFECIMVRMLGQCLISAE